MSPGGGTLAEPHYRGDEVNYGWNKICPSVLCFEIPVVLSEFNFRRQERVSNQVEFTIWWLKLTIRDLIYFPLFMKTLSFPSHRHH